MRILKGIFLLALVAAAFFAGYLFKGKTPQSSGKSERKILYWVDPMHPAYKSDKPGIAPDCGMKLEPVYADGGGAAPAMAAGQPDASNLPPGTIQLTPEKQQLIGVKYGTAEVTHNSQTLRAVGKVAYDESRISHVHTKYEGWIDKVFVDFTGEFIRKGQPLLTIYSPELLASQRELLLAARAKDVMKKSSLESAIDQSESLFQAARQRLELWDITDAQIQKLLETRQPVKNVTLYAPVGGFVLERKAFSQVKVMPDTDLYVVADLSRVWIMADVFEYEASKIHLGQKARVELSYAPGKAFLATVSYIQPQVDPTTRTLKVRLEVANPGVQLKPDMFVDVNFDVPSAAGLTVPSEAVLDAGDKKTVFVDLGNGYLEPRTVETGEQKDGRTAILRGLKAGDRIVTSGNFLIDSESQMKAAASGMGEHRHD